MAEREAEAAFASAMLLATGSVLPMALRSAIELDLLELIKKCGEGKGASASQLAALLPTTNPNAADMIDRILRLLAAHSVLTCTLHTTADGGVERRYSLAPVCKFLTSNEDGGSLAPVSLFIQNKILMEPWYHLSDVIIEGGVPIEKAHGMNSFAFAAKDPGFSMVLNQAMHQPTTIIMKRILEVYKGFVGVKSLVDVGGGTGASTKLIVSKFPSIKAITFDLPYVVQQALPHPGVEFVGGDMFAEVPKADAIFMKNVCHDWDDANCLKLLKNCYEALPENGKVILAETIVPEDPHSEAAVFVSMLDVHMMTVSPRGRERTEKEFYSLAKAAGFEQLIRVCMAFNFWIIELHKSN